MAFEKCWRWFGPNDSITLPQMRQMGIEGVVTALHHLPNGAVWPVEEIVKVKQAIEACGMRWSVVESLPVHEEIKLMGPGATQYLDNYRQSLLNLGQCGIDLVVYNFMPVIDWIRTDLNYTMADGTSTMLFHYPALAAFDSYILKRKGAESDYPAPLRAAAKSYYNQMSDAERDDLARNLIVVTQGFIDGVVKGSEGDFKDLFLEHIYRYQNIDGRKLRDHLAIFLGEILPVAEEAGIRMALHPDDPPFPVLGLPRIAGSANDFRKILAISDSPSHGITFCSGSLAARRDNQLSEMAKEFAHRTHFLHLRNIQWKDEYTFYESGHLEGIVDMAELISLFLTEQARRESAQLHGSRIPLRPDHGVRMLSDFEQSQLPGYTLIGRLKGLSELRGIEAGILKQRAGSQQSAINNH